MNLKFMIFFHKVNQTSYFIQMYMYIDHICRSEVGTVFSLSWLITWFGHVLGDLDSIVRLYDFFMASAPLMPIYMAASVSIYIFIYIF